MHATEQPITKFRITMDNPAGYIANRLREEDESADEFLELVQAGSACRPRRCRGT